MDFEEGGLKDCEEISGDDVLLGHCIFLIVRNLFPEDLIHLGSKGRQLIFAGLREGFNLWQGTGWLSDSRLETVGFDEFGLSISEALIYGGSWTTRCKEGFESVCNKSRDFSLEICELLSYCCGISALLFFRWESCLVEHIINFELLDVCDGFVDHVLELTFEFLLLLEDCVDVGKSAVQL